MRIVIVGQGAIGLLWYSKLSQQKDNRISLRCSTRVKSLPEQVTMSDINAVEHAVTLNQANNDLLQQAELVIFCVKAFDVCNAVNDIAALLPLNVPLILCHNGMINLADIDKKSQGKSSFFITSYHTWCKKSGCISRETHGQRRLQPRTYLA
jgi:2-dehydropantoate 2-reductase